MARSEFYFLRRRAHTIETADEPNAHQQAGAQNIREAFACGHQRQKGIVRNFGQAKKNHRDERQGHEQDEENRTGANDFHAANVEQRGKPNDRERDAPMRQDVHLWVEEFEIVGHKHGVNSAV
jgi:hypothetical protein